MPKARMVLVCFHVMEASSVPGLTTAAEQVSTWATGDIIIYAAAIGIVVAGFMCFALGRGVGAFIAVVIGTCIAGGAIGIARSIYGWVHTAALDVPHATYAAIHAATGLFA